MKIFNNNKREKECKTVITVIKKILYKIIKWVSVMKLIIT